MYVKACIADNYSDLFESYNYDASYRHMISLKGDFAAGELSLYDRTMAYATGGFGFLIVKDNEYKITRTIGTETFADN